VIRFFIFRRKKAQAAVEYFLAFAVLIILTVIGLRAFIDQLRTKGEDFFQKEVTRMQNINME